MLDIPNSQIYVGTMTKLIDEAFKAVRRLSPHHQDAIALAIFKLAGATAAEPVPLSPEESEAIARSQAAAARGEFATDEEIEAIWAKYGARHEDL
jgi:hypothetical protein